MSQFQPPSQPGQHPWQPQQGYQQYQPPWPPQEPQQPYSQPQYYQQPPQGYPPQPPQPRTRAPMRAFMGWFALGILVGIGIGYAAHVPPISKSNNIVAQQVTAQTTIPANQPTSAATSAPNSVGSPVTVDAWIITVNSVMTQTSGQYSNPKSGDVFLVVDVTSENTASSNQLISSGASFRLIDSTGQAYSESITGIGKPPDGTVPANSKLRGQISYEVPTTEHNFTFEFLDVYTQNSATWNMSVK